MAAMRRTMRSLPSKASQFRTLSSTNPTPSSFIARSFHSDDIFGNINNKRDNSNNNLFESTDDFERSLFGPDSKSGGGGGGDGPIADSFYRTLDRVERAGRSGGGFGPGSWRGERGGGMGEGFDTLSDGLDDKLKRAATTFQVGEDIMDDDYSFRPDVNFIPGTTYTPRDLDLTKPGIQKSYKQKPYAFRPFLSKHSFKPSSPTSFSFHDNLHLASLPTQPPAYPHSKSHTRSNPLGVLGSNPIWFVYNFFQFSNRTEIITSK